eukprot:scaffold67615_cov15-Tisochrysis_lutea.AAC.1
MSDGMYEQFMIHSHTPVPGGAAAESLENATLVKLATVMHQATVKAGDAVIKQDYELQKTAGQAANHGEAGNCFYIVEHGKLAAYKSLPHGPTDERPSLMYGPGSYFGELALLQNGPRAATVSVGMSRHPPKKASAYALPQKKERKERKHYVGSGNPPHQLSAAASLSSICLSTLFILGYLKQAIRA